MSKIAVEHIFNGDNVKYADGYDYTQTNLGYLISQNSGVFPEDNYVSAYKPAVARVGDITGVTTGHIDGYSFDDDTDYIYVFNSTAATTRRVMLFIYKRTTQEFFYKGFITLTYSTATNHTPAGSKIDRSTYNTGTVAVSGTAVTGSSSAWTTARIAAGARIGFGSNDPRQITTWYEISAIGSNTGITLATTAGTIGAGTAYVIEEIRIYTANSNATATNGGLYVTKGIHPGIFDVTGTTISAAVSTDNVRAVYWLKDAGTNTSITPTGFVIEPLSSYTSQDAYLLHQESSTSLRIYKFNLRAALTVSSGNTTDAFVFKTGESGGLAGGSFTAINNGVIATPAHGTSSGVKSIFFAATNRVYRVPVNVIIDGSTAFMQDCMAEVPPGSTSSIGLSTGLQTLAYSETIDRFIGVPLAGYKNYIFKYDSNNNPFEEMFGIGSGQNNGITVSPEAPPHCVTNYVTAVSSTVVCHVNGMVYLGRYNQSTAGVALLYAFPVGGHWDYAFGDQGAATQNRVITPAISTPNARSYYKIAVNYKKLIGSSRLGIQPEPFKIYARIDGIRTDFGDWVRIYDDGDLSHMPVSDEIQFMFEFRLTNSCLSARIFNLMVVYDDIRNDEHFEFSVNKSVNKTFVWRFATAFNDDVPQLYVKVYDVINGGLILEDNTTDENFGTFEQSTNNGGDWIAWDISDKTNETTYYRYTPNELADNTKFRVVLTQ